MKDEMDIKISENEKGEIDVADAIIFYRAAWSKMLNKRSKKSIEQEVYIATKLYNQQAISTIKTADKWPILTKRDYQPSRLNLLYDELSRRSQARNFRITVMISLGLFALSSLSLLIKIYFPDAF
ncbi:hypothetical protein [Idiomarina piscisalsi]|uniref:Uncharacterized protein n=1 Tax=Idiomarina piscisalsi TaxID=1096243 RepID=A0A432YXG1_9GAMM|nr:hypothetical protein [Idiomarina piscisalsi]RUO68019.1 hypothetical protein CWI73_03945 [Idiomarina piscisalsi]